MRFPDAASAFAAQRAVGDRAKLVAALRDQLAYLGRDVPSYDCGKRRMYDAGRALLRSLVEE
jgi:hypothetical protein